MYTTVPGGQIVYVETNGAIGFSQAHSSSIPEGSYVSGFTYTPSDTAGVPGRFNFNGGPGSKGWTACPQADGTYKIFARLEGLVFLPECNAFEPFANAYAGARAWQYI